MTDHFGFNTWVEPTARRQQERALAGTWRLWAQSSRSGNPPAAAPRPPRAGLFLAPTVAQSQESPPFEEVVFSRDELANRVWAVETIIPDPLGGGRDGLEAAKLLRNELTGSAQPAAADQAVPDPPEQPILRYTMMTTVPENWIPMISVTLLDEQDQTPASAFLQGAMPRIPLIEPALDALAEPILAHQVVLPRGRFLSQQPVAQPNTVYEEELLRSGLLLRRSARQTRWCQGQT